jgi:thioredoxin-related protein
LTVIRLNVQDRAGRDVAAAYGFQYTPTFILLDGDGQELWRTVGAVDPVAVRQSLAGR